LPSDLAFKFLNGAHRAVMKLSGGKLGWTAIMPVLELTTTGRKSGQARTVILTSPLQLGEGDTTLVVIASRGGDDHHPAWFCNLQAQPQILVRYKGGPQTSMTARVATAAEKANLWPAIVSAYKSYGSYQQRTQRDIPVVFLEPDGSVT
jgi:deazaflavin-dependent oxidoreductase (nitroreductase family)